MRPDGTPCVLGLDLASTTGWAVLGEHILAYGTWNIAPRHGESPGCRYLHLRRHLEHVDAAYRGLELVVYEQAHHRGRAATEYGIGCVTTVQAWCAEQGIDHAGVHTGTLKKFATGSGAASKNDMIAAACQRWFPAQVTVMLELDDNEADALWLAAYGCEEVLALSAPPQPEGQP